MTASPSGWSDSGRKIDSDNLAGGFKAVRDQVAKWCGRDDKCPRCGATNLSDEGVEGLQ